MGSALFFYANWLIWTVVGAILGRQLPGLATLGLDFAMIATFAAMAAPQLKAPTPVMVAVIAGSVAYAAQGLPYKLGLVLATLAGVAVGHVPVAVLAAIVVPEALAPGGQLNLSPTNPYLVGTLVAGAIAWKSGRILVAVVVSFAVFGLLRWLA